MTMATAQAKWERKTENAGQKWKSAVSADKYAAGMAAFGLPVGPMTRAAYDAGVGAISAADFQEAVRGKGAKWASKLREAVSK